MRRKTSIGIIFFTVFLDLLGFGMVLPLMPLYASDIRFQATPTQIGWLMACYSLMQFFFAPLWGRLSDRIGRRPVLIIGLFGSSLSYLVYGLAQSLWVLFIARSMAGIMGANIVAAQAAMADISSREERARAMGMIGAAFGLGFVLGPAFGAFLSGYGLQVTPLVAAAITALNAFAALFFLGETYSGGTQSSSFSAHPLFGNSWHLARLFPGALLVCLLMGGFMTLFAAFEVVLPLWGKEVLGWGMSTTGWVFTYVGVVLVIVQGGLVRRLVPFLGEKKTAIIGLFFVSLGLAFLPFGGMERALISLAFIAIGAGLVHPSFSSLVSLNTSPESQGFMMGLFQSMSALGRGVGPVLGGVFFGTLVGGVFQIVSLGIVLILVLFIVVQKRMLDLRSESSDASPTVP